MKRMITRKEAAQLLKCTPQSISYMVSNGILKGHKVKDRILVDSDTITKQFDTILDYVSTKENVEKLTEVLHKKEAELEDRIKDLEYEMGLIDSPSRAASDIGATLLLSELNHYQDMLNHREFSILRDFIEGMRGFDELADKYCLTRERIRQVIVRGLNRIRMNDASKRMTDEIILLNQHIKELETEKENDREQYLKSLSGQENKPYSPVMNKKLVECDLSVRALNCIRYLELETLGDLANSDKRLLMAVRNMGKKTMQEFEILLEHYGLEFAKKE